MRIKAKGKLRDAGKSGRRYSLEDGDEITVTGEDEETAAGWVKKGWVTNLDTGEDLAPDTAPVKLKMN